jgi:Rrf2 family transcriptional regulator, iron-sulfur cluster assembly transcription factor
MISNSCKYGIRAVAYIANQPEGSGKIGIKKISEDLDLPSPFLAKILQLLAREKILCSSKGPHGGFSLLKDPRNITLLDIIRIIDGDNTFNDCALHNGFCNTFEACNIICPLHEEYSKVMEEFIKIFSSTTIYSLVKTSKLIKEVTI